MIRERQHRLPSEHYLGRKAVAFTLGIQPRRPLLLWEEGRQAFHERLAISSQLNGCSVPIYTIMPDHMHILLIGEKECANQLQAIHSFKIRTGIWLKTNRASFKWQKDCYDHIVRYREGWQQQARYIALNPVRNGLVTVPEEWSFTGAIGYELKDVLTEMLW